VSNRTQTLFTAISVVRQENQTALPDATINIKWLSAFKTNGAAWVCAALAQTV